MGARVHPDSAIAAVDAANFALEGSQPNVVTLVALFAPGGWVDREGDADVGRLRRALDARVRGIEALCRRPVERHGDWRWEAATPDLAHHVRVLDGPGRAGVADAPESLEAVCARVVMQPLAADRPPWELLLVPRARPGRCALLIRLHHAVADGLAAEALVGALADPDAPVDGAAEGATVGKPRSGEPRSGEPRSGEPRAAEPGPRGIRSIASRGARIVVQVAAVFRRSVRSRTLLGPLGATRDVAFGEVDLRALHDGARRLGGTVNDAFLAAYGQGIRAVLLAAGEPLPERVPISNPVRLDRRAGEGNATGVMLVGVPVDPDDVRPVVARVAATTRSAAARARREGTFELMRGPRVAALLMRFATTQRAVGAIASNLPGPGRALRIDGAELEAAWPLSLLSGNVRLGVVGLSYAGCFRFGVQTDADHLPPARMVAEAITSSLRRIAAA
ncbi:wax ester/triacylglycerol synthase domain-containing protein [Agromyces sp. SYSU T00194]|uniref:wax ester/triacylglycerol synthase domain-containing protein n=1 Tax=Agromyces chitinivorans TaxID=3158560 RepID=UPI00339A75A1